jgi:hypothetical protein
MSTPTVAQVVAAVRAQLSDVVTPAVGDDVARKSLAMIDHLLQTVEVRAEHEIEWMVGHVADVVALADRFVVEGRDTARVKVALDGYRRGHQDSLATSAVTANYALAAEVLSAMLEATVDGDGPLALTAREVLRRDVGRGVDVVGEFELVPP